MMQRLAPSSRWRHRLTRRPWIASRPVCPQREHTRRRRRSRTLTITPSTVKLTSITDAPDRRKSRLNAVVTRTSPSSQAAELEHPAACCEGGGVSLALCATSEEILRREAPAHAPIRERPSPPNREETRKYALSMSRRSWSPKYTWYRDQGGW